VSISTPTPAPLPASPPPAPAPEAPATLLDVQTPPPAEPAAPATLLDMESPPTEMSAPAAQTPAPIAAPRRGAKLIVAAGHQLTPQPEYDLPPQAAVHIGRNTASNAINQIPVQDKEVSRSHARITYQTGQYFVEDLGSTTGTTVDGIRLTSGQPQPLQNGAEITVGTRVTFRLEISAEKSAGDETLLELNTDEIRAKYEGQDPRRTLYD